MLDVVLQEVPWFKRAWVLQEVAVARHATIIFGTDIMSFRDLGLVLNFTTYIPRAHLSIRMLGLTALMRFHWSMAIGIQSMATGEAIDRDRFLLQDIVMSALFGLQATRPEDRIFSLYGLCKRFGYDLPAPDYTRDLTDLDFEVAQCFLKYDGRLKFLMMNSGTTSVAAGLPSWVPSTRGLWQSSEYGLKIPSISIASGPGCSASGTSTVEFELHGTRLRVKGRIFDYIAELGDVQKMDIDLNEKIETMPAIVLTEVIESWWHILDCAKSLQYPRPMSDEPALYHINDQPFNQAAAELFTMAKVAAGEGRSAEQLETNMSHLEFIRNKTASPDLTERKNLVIPGEAEDQIQQAGSGYVLSESIRHSLAMMGEFCYWRALGLSSRGYMAMFPHGSKVGDKIVVLHGTGGAVVIRPVDGVCQFVGAVYVQGIMGGEFWETGSEKDDIWIEII